MFANHPGYLDLTPTQYGTALTWLREVGIVTEDGSLAHSGSPVELALFEAALLNASPLWLRDADQLINMPDDLPEDAISAGEALGLSPRQATAVVHTAWGKVDAAARKQIGSAGEEALANLLTELTGVTVDYVADYADGLGYDIAVHADGLHLDLEVKTTTRRGRLTIYLSRNEYEVMRDNPAWRLTVVFLNSERQAGAVGTIDPGWVRRHAPADATPLGRWESVRFDIPPDAIQRGLTDISDWAGPRLSGRHLLRAGTGERPPAWISAAPAV
ncbi:DUF3883 domain-containing protein [Actinomadura graeca]|uniref:DUF3883 domain-containing protein n=1 Tax=Actinomadura graeca TaxID=2750812 RepID=A0ABX8QXP2_9ACTN|nr:DUF3883 domain-containing protein [Actinomadura graeca]QXJ22492.1 DUF3883 domain-containing protein [Actinomadura graeca]